MTDVNTLVQQAISAYKANDKTKAKELLLQAVDLDEHNEQAWMWMSTVVDSLEEQQICLENVVQLNPNNERAKKGLAVIKEKLGKSGAAAPAPPPPPPPAPAADPSNPWEGTGFDSNPFSAFETPAPAPPPVDPAPAAYGSGAGGDPTTGEQYDSWIDSLGINSSSPPPPPPAPAKDDPWASMGSGPSKPQANPFVADSSASPDPWDSPASTNQQADPWDSVASESSGSNPFYTEEASSDPWGTVTGVDPWAASPSQSVPASDPFGTDFPQEEEAASSVEPETEVPDEGFEYAEVSDYTSFDFDEADAEDDYSFSEDELQDDPFGDDNLGDFDPFPGEARPKAMAEGASYLQQIPAELRGKSGGSNALLLVVILVLLNLAAAAGLVIG